MDSLEYALLYSYLHDDELPEGRDPEQYKDYASKFKLENSMILTNDSERKVVQTHEIEWICSMFHDDPTSAHCDFNTTYGKINQRYFWSTMYRDVKNFVQSCDTCQRQGKPRKQTKIHPITPSSLFDRWGVDIVGPLPVTQNGNRYIIVAVDYFSRWPEAQPLKEANANTVANFLYREIICRFGAPQVLQSDRGTHFLNQVIKELTEKFRIKHSLSSPYHPQSNGLVERFNRSLCQGLAKVSETIFNWDEYIQPVLFAYRVRRLLITRRSPYEIVYGINPALQMDKLGTNTTIIDRLIDVVDKVPQIRQSAKDALLMNQRKIVQAFGHETKNLFEVNDLVLLYDKAKDTSHSNKLAEKWKGPYRITKVLPKGAYRIADNNGPIKNPFNGNLMKLYKGRLDWQPIVLV